MASELSKQLKWRSTILLEPYRNQNGPTNSAKEPDFKAFLKGQKSQVSPNTWTTKLSWRMDAEFYRQRPDIGVPSKGKVASAAHSISARLLSVVKELEAVRSDLQATFADMDAAAVPLKSFFEPVENIAKLDRSMSYKLLGVRWWGEGTFVRAEKGGKEIKANKLNRVSAGWLVYSRLFAFRGSFAIVAKEHDGGFMSNEFPTFRIKPAIKESELISSYVIHCLNSPQYLREVDRVSTGSTKTSRNRYKEDRFLSTCVAVPRSTTKLKSVVALLEKASGLRGQHAEILDEIKGLNKNLSLLLPLAIQAPAVDGTIEPVLAPV